MPGNYLRCRSTTQRRFVRTGDTSTRAPGSQSSYRQQQISMVRVSELAPSRRPRMKISALLGDTVCHPTEASAAVTTE